MAKELTATKTALPAHIAAAFGGNAPNSDLRQGVSAGYPIISYKGKSWALVQNGERNLITRGGDGHDADDPASSIAVVIVKANPHLNKVYYPDGYEEGSTERPICHSNDSITPAPDAQEPQAKRCAVCPHNQWGSKITETGARGKACSDARRMAVVPSEDLENPMLLRVPAASLKSLLAYANNLDKRGVPYQALVTRIGFDHTVAYPSFTFKAERWLGEDEVGVIRGLMDDDLVQNIIALTVPASEEEPGADDGFELPPGGPAPRAAAPAKPAAPATQRRAARTATVEEVEEAIGEAPAAEPAKAAKASGFGGGKAAKAAPAEKTDPVTVLAEGAMSELDEALGLFDDE